jgi:gliding motility-associated peptidyl-prolyl isomerase
MKIYKVIFFVFIGFVSCVKQEARSPVSVSKTTTLASTSNLLKKINKAEEIKIENYIKKDTLHDYIRSSYGFWYCYIQKNESNNSMPLKGDVVQISYDILDLKNQIMYSKEINGLKEYIIDKEDFIPGLQVGIKLMKVGETMKFIIPSFNAFGVLGDENKIGMNTSIISRVTLININK